MGEAIKMKKKYHKWNTETFVKEMNNMNSNILITSEYINFKTKVHCICLLDKYEWDVTPDDLLHGRGCPKCGGKLKKTHQEFMNDFYEKCPISDRIEIIGKYINMKTLIECKCKLDGNIWFARPYDLLKGHGCPKCCKSTKKTNEDFLKMYNEKNYNSNIEILGEYITNDEDILVRCKIDNYTWNSTPHKLLSGYGCPVCKGKVVVKGINDIATFRPDLVKYYDDINDAYSSTLNSSKKYNMHCIYCGYQKTSTNHILSNYGFSCPICSDGISYPNKFSRAFLLQLPIKNFIPEYSPKWANGKKYDNYFEYNGQAYILEMDGGFHYNDNKMNGQTKEESKLIDSIKDNLANEHNIKVIRVDSIKSNKEYISNNILSSVLSNIFDLSKIDWNKCEEYAISNIVKDVCEMYNNITKNTLDIANYFKISQTAVQTYLNKGTKLRWCNYNGSIVCKIMNEPMIAKDETGKIIAEAVNVYDMIEKLQKVFPEKTFRRNPIRAVCRGKQNKHKGIVFEYINGGDIKYGSA